MTTPDLERLARETAEKIVPFPGKDNPWGDIWKDFRNYLEREILSALRAAQSAQNEDTARLDWLGKNYDEGCGRPPCLDVYAVWAAGISLRAAIDQARGEGK